MHSQSKQASELTTHRPPQRARQEKRGERRHRGIGPPKFSCNCFVAGSEYKQKFYESISELIYSHISCFQTGTPENVRTRSQQQRNLCCVQQAEAGCNILMPQRRAHVFVYTTSIPASALITKSSIDIFVGVFYKYGTTFWSWDTCIPFVFNTAPQENIQRLFGLQWMSERSYTIWPKSKNLTVVTSMEETILY